MIRFRSIKRLICLITVCCMVCTNTRVYAAITVGVSAQSKYQKNGNCSYDDVNSIDVFVSRFVREITYDLRIDDPVAIKQFAWLNNYAWEVDMKPGNYKGDSIDDVNFMLYCGHGLKKGGDDNLPNNSLHYYTCNSSTSFHKSGVETDVSSNLFTSEARWGRSGTQTRWVALFTCNFLNSKDPQYTQMMQGIRICMGFGSTMYIDSRQGTMFGEDLYEGVNIIDSFLRGASTYQRGMVDGGCEAVVIYTDNTRDDTIKTVLARQEPIGGSTYYYVLSKFIP